jgi:methylated-DNA-protein-cysteine methyltransferase-like protein
MPQDPFLMPQSRRKANQRNPKTRRGAPIFGLCLPEIPGKSSAVRDQAFMESIRSIPRGKVATYGQVAAAAGYPRYHRAVARFLRTAVPGEYPWQRVIGAGGEIKTTGQSAAEQRMLLKMEGVTFTGRRVNLKRHQHVFDAE